MALTKEKLANSLVEQVGLNKREAKDMVEAFFEEISIQLELCESVKLIGFGSFHVLDKAARMGRNLMTGESALITARRVVTFHASEKLKSIIDKEL